MQKHIFYCFFILLFIAGCGGNTQPTLSDHKEPALILGESAFIDNGLFVDHDGKPINGNIRFTQETLKMTVIDGSGKIVINDQLVMASSASNILTKYKYFVGTNAFFKDKVFVNSDGEVIKDDVVLLKNMLPRTDVFTVTDGIITGTYNIYIGEMLYEEIPYVKGKKEGVATQYLKAERQKGMANSESAMIINYVDHYVKKTYVNNVLVIQRFLNYGKKPTKDNIYENGMLVRVINYDRDGKKQKLTNYKNNLKHGDEISYNKDGAQISVYNYINGKIEGNVKVYYLNNPKALLIDKTYVNGKLEGTERYYYESGELAIETTYKDGEQISPTIGYYKNGSKRFYINIGSDLKDGYCFDKNGNKARDFTKEIEHRYSITGLLQFACPEFSEK